MTKNSEAGFFSSLFDFKLKHFITLKILRILYAIYAVVFIGLGIIFMIFAASQGGSLAALYVILTPIAVFLMLVLTRLSIEFTAVVFRLKDSVDQILDIQTRNTSATA